MLIDVEDVFNYFVVKSIKRGNSGTYVTGSRYDAESKKYQKHMDCFERITRIAMVSNLNFRSYMDYVFEKVPSDKNVWPKYLCDMRLVKKYARYRDLAEQSEKLISYYDKTCKFIQDGAERENVDGKVFFKRLVHENKLVPHIVSGEISLYWICTIGKNNLNKILKLTEDMSFRVTLQKIIDDYDLYSSKIKDAFELLNKTKNNPFDRITTR